MWAHYTGDAAKSNLGGPVILPTRNSARSRLQLGTQRTIGTANMLWEHFPKCPLN